MSNDDLGKYKNEIELKKENDAEKLLQIYGTLHDLKFELEQIGFGKDESIDGAKAVDVINQSIYPCILKLLKEH
jgi:hypothetical protein